MLHSIYYQPIGTIHSPFKKLKGMPIQPAAAEGIRGKIIIDDQYAGGLDDLDGFSHIYLIYHMHLSKTYKLKITPFLDNKIRGVFATRAPKRPNPIGLSVVKLIRIESHVIEIENVDILDGTPLLDIKPYVPEMEAATQIELGWLSKYKSEMKSKKSDQRFK